MSKKSYSSVLRIFSDEVMVAFSFLIDDLGMADARFTDVVIPSVSYSGGSYGYRIMLDTDEVTVHTSVWIAEGTGRLFADLEKLVPGARRISASAQTVAALKKTLADQALVVREIHREISGPRGQRLVREAAGRDDL